MRTITREYWALSFSGGKDSTALLLEWLKRRREDPENYPLDEVVFIDTGLDFPQLLEHVDKIASVVEKEEILFTRLKPDYSFEYGMLEKNYGFPTLSVRWCNSVLKQQPFRRYMSKLLNDNPDIRAVISIVGLAADEAARLKRPNNKTGSKNNGWNCFKIHPLVEWGWTEKDCLDYCYAAGYDFGGLYKYYSRVSCWCCPLQSLSDMRNLYHHFPLLWKKLRDMEVKSFNFFHADYDLEFYELRFINEDKYPNTPPVRYLKLPKRNTPRCTPTW